MDSRNIYVDALYPVDLCQNNKYLSREPVSPQISVVMIEIEELSFEDDA